MIPRICFLTGLLVLAAGLASAIAQEKPAQHTEQPPLESNLPGPVIEPETASPPQARSGTLTLEERADIFVARKSYDDAVDYYQRAMKEQGSKKPALWNKLGIAYQQLQNVNAARRAYKEAIRLKKDFAEPWNNLGTTYYLEKRTKKSLKYYREAVKLNPNNASFHVNLGTSYYNLKKIPQAVEEYRIALGLNPNVLTQHSSMGTTVSARAADAKFYFYMAKIFASLGRSDEALRYLRHAFEDGFNDMKLVDEDPDLKKISELPAYIELRANPPKGIKE